MIGLDFKRKRGQTRAGFTLKEYEVFVASCVCCTVGFCTVANIYEVNRPKMSHVNPGDRFKVKEVFFRVGYSFNNPTTAQIQYKPTKHSKDTRVCPASR